VKKIKLLLIIHSLDLGGAEGQLYELVKGLDKKRYEPVVCPLTGDGPYVERMRREGVRVLPIARRLRHVPWKLLKLVNLIRREKFDIVQNVMFTAAVFGTVVARCCRVPVVINSVRSLGFLHYWYRRPVKRFLYKMSECVIANSNLTKSLLIKHRIAQAGKIHTVYNGVDLARFQPADNSDSLAKQKASIGIGENFPIIGMVANLSPVKNHDCFLKAIPTILKEFPRAAFLVFGGGSMKYSLERTAQSLGNQRRVFFWAREMTLPSCCV
jgi:glycosyltransferase involved in cell wall biosynthesis